jgi:hypothetical protein
MNGSIPMGAIRIGPQRLGEEAVPDLDEGGNNDQAPFGWVAQLVSQPAEPAHDLSDTARRGDVEPTTTGCTCHAARIIPSAPLRPASTAFSPSPLLLPSGFEQGCLRELVGVA